MLQQSKWKHGLKSIFACMLLQIEQINELFDFDINTFNSSIYGVLT
jgi:hypothetical protein